MASEDLFSEGIIYSEDIIFDKENIGQVVEEVETETEIVHSDELPVETEVAAIPTEEVLEEPKPQAENPPPAKGKPTEKTNEQRLTSLPLARIRNIMKLDPDLNIASLEAVFAVTKATEMFIDSLAKESFVHTSQAKKKTVQKRDVDMAIASVDSLIFLEGAMNF